MESMESMESIAPMIQMIYIAFSTRLERKSLTNRMKLATESCRTIYIYIYIYIYTHMCRPFGDLNGSIRISDYHPPFADHCRRGNSWVFDISVTLAWRNDYEKSKL